METLFHPYKARIEEGVLAYIETLGDKTALRDACEYALTTGGKRFRPALVLMIAESLSPLSKALLPALAVEFFHTASLVADDLPCMDNEELRRNKPTVHKVFGEAKALLSSYALLAAGYECISAAATTDRIAALAIENASRNIGIFGATGGQFLDIYPPDQTLATFQEVIRRKTISLFEIAFVLGWLFGDGDEKKLPLVKKAAAHFGMAFQIADDIDDMVQDLQNQRAINMATLLGKEKAHELFHEELKQFRALLPELGLQNSPIPHLATYLEKSVL